MKSHGAHGEHRDEQDGTTRQDRRDARIARQTRRLNHRWTQMMHPRFHRAPGRPVPARWWTIACSAPIWLHSY